MTSTISRPREKDPVVIELYSTGFCAPCRRARHILERAVANTNVIVTDINVADHPELAEQYDITSTPTLRALAAGHELWRYVGVPTLAELRLTIATLVQNTSPADQ